MSASREVGLADTIVLTDTVRLRAKVAATNGKAAPAGGNNLPAGAVGDAGRDLERAVAKLEWMAREIGRELRFEVHLDGGQAAIFVLDRTSGDIIRRIPREDVMTLMSATGAAEFRLFDQIV